jgi:hypothetical protein
MNYDKMTREELIAALEAVGAGGVSAQRITQPGIPDGWQFVPVEPTCQMAVAAVQATRCMCDTDHLRGIYKAMLAAAPVAPANPQATYTPVGVVVPDEDIGMPNVFAARMLSGVIVEGETLYRAAANRGTKV